MDQSKQDIRKRITLQRKHLSVEEQIQRSKKIARLLSQSNHFTNAKNIAYYLPVSGEADPTFIDSSPTAHEKEFYLPIVIHKGGIRLFFAKINMDTQYQKNRYGIAEPIYTKEDLLPAHELDLVIMPLVSFDHKGNRLGMGGGYYDRTFAFKNTQQQKAPFLMGYAYDFQHSRQLQTESWDIPLNGVVTESSLIDC